MVSELLRPLLTTRGPFASVYFEGSHDTQDAAAHLDVRWRGLREQLVEQGAARSVTADIERAVMDLRPPIGRGGRALIAGADGVVVNKHLLRPPAATVVRVSELPYIVPIVEHDFKYPNYLLVTVDHTGADITVHTNSTLRDEDKPSTAAAIRSTRLPEPKRRDTVTRSCAPTKPPARTCVRSPTV